MLRYHLSLPLSPPLSPTLNVREGEEGREGDGMVVVMYCRDNRTVYVIHNPSFYETGVETTKWIEINKKSIEEWFGIKVDEIIRLNTGTEWDWEKAEEILNDENCEELKI